MAKKKFTNQSKYDLAIQLRVRKGSIPGTTKETKDFTLCSNGEIMIAYGDAENPFVESLSINGICAGSVTTETFIVLDKSSQMDDLFNMHDTIDISYIDGAFTLNFRNTWTVSVQTDSLLPWDDWFYKLSYRRDEVNRLHKEVIQLQNTIQHDIDAFNKKLTDYQTLIASNSALLIVKNIIEMDDLEYKDYCVDVDAIELPAQGYMILDLCGTIAELAGAVLIVKSICNIGKYAYSFFSESAAEVLEAGESCLEAGIDVAADTAAIGAEEVGLEVGAEVAEEAIEGASCSSLASTGIGILIAVGLDMIFGAINGAKEKKELDKQISDLTTALNKSQVFVNTVSTKDTELDAYIVKEEKRFRGLIEDLSKISGQEATFDYQYPTTIAEIEQYKTAQSKAIRQYGVFQTLKQNWVSAVGRNPSIKKDVFLAMLINFVPAEVSLEMLSKYWDILKKYSDTMQDAES